MSHGIHVTHDMHDRFYDSCSMRFILIVMFMHSSSKYLVQTTQPEIHKIELLLNQCMLNVSFFF